MKIKSITGVTESENIRIQENVAAILITADVAFGTEKIATKVSRAGMEDINNIVNIEVKKLGEMAAQNEGFVLAYKAGGKEHMIIPIGVDGGVQFSKSAELVIALKNLNAAKNYDVYAIGGHQKTNVMYMFERGTVNNGDASKTVQLAGYLNAYVANAAELDTVKVSLSTHSPEFSTLELQMYNNLANDIVQATQSVTDTAAASGDFVKFGFINLLKVPHAAYAQSMQITTDSTADVEYFLQKPLLVNF